MPTYTIEGFRSPHDCAVQVVEGDSRRRLDPRLDLRNHSPTGLEWGYGGSGPAQLALAILAQVVGEMHALACYHDYKWDVVAALPYKEWTITSEQVEEWVAKRRLGGPV